MGIYKITFNCTYLSYRGLIGLPTDVLHFCKYFTWKLQSIKSQIDIF